jgi:hypothetical protein
LFTILRRRRLPIYGKKGTAAHAKKQQQFLAYFPYFEKK